MQIKCPKCGKGGKANDSLAGKKIRCPACKEIFVAAKVEEDVPTFTPDVAPIPTPAPAATPVVSKSTIPQRPKLPRRPVTPTVPATPSPAVAKRLSPALIIGGLFFGLAVIGYLVYSQMAQSTQVVTSSIPTPNALTAQSSDKSASDDNLSKEDVKNKIVSIPSLDIKKKLEEVDVVITNLKHDIDELRNNIATKHDDIKKRVKELPIFSVAPRLTSHDKTLLRELPKPKPFPKSVAISDNDKKILGQQVMPEYKTNAREYLPKELQPYLETKKLSADLDDALKVVDTAVKQGKLLAGFESSYKEKVTSKLLPAYRIIIKDINLEKYDAALSRMDRIKDVVESSFEDTFFMESEIKKHFRSYFEKCVSPLANACKILKIIDDFLKGPVPAGLNQQCQSMREAIQVRNWESALRAIAEIKSALTIRVTEDVFKYVPDPKKLLSEDLVQKEKVIRRLVEEEKQIASRLQAVEQDTEAYNKMVSSINTGTLEDADKVTGALARQSSLANDIAPYRALLARLKTEQTAVETERKKVEQENAPTLQILQRLDPLMGKLNEQSLTTSDLSGLEAGDLDEIRTLLSKYVDQQRTLTAYQNYLAGLQALSEKAYEKSVRHLQVALQSKEGFQEATEAFTVAQYHHLEQQRQIAEERKAQVETYLRQGDDAMSEARKAKVGETKAHWQKAIALYTKALEIDDTNATAYRQRGLCRSFLPDIDGAVSDIRKATELVPAMKNEPEIQKMLEVLQKAAEGKAFVQGLRIGAKVAATLDYSDLRDLRTLPDDVVESTIESLYQGYAPVYKYEAESSGSFRDGFFKGFKDAARIR